MKLRQQVIPIFLALLVILVSAGSGMCAGPIMTCDPTRTTGIGAAHFTDGNGKAVTITSVTPKSATSNTPAYCEVKGYRYPLDLFIIALPDSWSGTYWQTGNGGAAGSLGSITTGVQRGYVSVSGSGGHDVSQEVGLPTFQFAYPPTDTAAHMKIDDYCYGSIHLTKLLALDMTKAYYGAGAKPVRSYYNSCSTGGRQGLLEAQRYPTDFDGLVIGSPVHYLSHITQRGVWERQALASDPWTATGGNVLPKLPILAAAVMAKCDAIDGLADGLIDDPRKCPFNPLTDLPACASDVDGTGCFTKAQMKAIKMIYDGPPGLAFSSTYPSHAYSGEEMVPGTGAATSNWAGWVIPSPYTPTAVSRGFDLGAGWVQWVGLPLSGKGGPGWDWSTYSWSSGDPQLVVANTSELCDAIDPDLSLLRARRGKIIHYDGWPDPATGAFMTVKYYDTVRANMGIDATNSFYKLYMIPGMGHCSGGTGCGTADWQTYLENWVERGVEPAAVVGSRPERGNPADPNNYMTARTRPLCPYPEVARYSGSGSIDDAANFLCVPPIEVKIDPKVVSLSRTGMFTAYITLPKGFEARDWGIRDVVCDGAHAVGASLEESIHTPTYTATFNTRDLVGVTPGNAVPFKVSLTFHHEGKEAVTQATTGVQVLP
jgi:hypothetical protein